MNGLVDLHRHLDGSLRPTTVEELARAEGLQVPEKLPFFVGMGLESALSRFAFTLRLLQRTEALTRVAREMCEDAVEEGVTTLEVRFAPQLHGADPGEAVDAVLEGLGGRAGLILCGLYGEPPEVMERLVTLAGTRPGVVGIDLAGAPTAGADFAMHSYAAPFRRAAGLGLGRTVHAGEGRPPAEIAVAVKLLGAQRIGHGTTVLDDPSVVALLVDRGVTIEACPTSNVHTSVIPAISAHPIARWLDVGLRVTVCTDNTLLSSVDAPTELNRVGTISGMNSDRISDVVRMGHEAAFRRRG